MTQLVSHLQAAQTHTSPPLLKVTVTSNCPVPQLSDRHAFIPLKPVSVSHLCLGSEDTELQLWTDSSVEDFRGPSGDGSRLLSDGDGDSRLLFPGEGHEPLRHSSSSSALPASGNSASEGRTRIGGTLRSPVLGAEGGLTDRLGAAPRLLMSGHTAAAEELELGASSTSASLWWRLPPCSAG